MRAVLARRGAPIDAERGRLRAELGLRAEASDLVACLVNPWAASLESEHGRSYVRIVDQLRGRFAAWRTESDPATAAHLVQILDEIERSRGRGRVTPLDRERVVGMIVLLTGLTADRARRIDDGVAVELDHRAFVASLIGMCASVIAD